jgi:hypothetical protein
LSQVRPFLPPSQIVLMALHERRPPYLPQGTPLLFLRQIRCVVGHPVTPDYLLGTAPLVPEHLPRRIFLLPLGAHTAALGLQRSSLLPEVALLDTVC